MFFQKFKKSKTKDLGEWEYIPNFQLIGRNIMPKGMTLTIINEKGGVGKSLATMNLAYYLSQTDRVIVIDLDGQGENITSYMIGQQEDIVTILDVVRGKKKIKDAIVPVNLNLDLIPANNDLTYISEGDRLSVFSDTINELRKEYDYIMIDVTPSPNRAHIFALYPQGQNVIPILNSEISSVNSMANLHSSVIEMKKTMNPSIHYLGIIINRYKARTILSQEVVKGAELMAKKMNTTVFKTPIRDSVTLGAQTGKPVSIFEYAPNSPVAEDYMKLGKELKERLDKEYYEQKK